MKTQPGGGKGSLGVALLGGAAVPPQGGHGVAGSSGAELEDQPLGVLGIGLTLFRRQQRTFVSHLGTPVEHGVLGQEQGGGQACALVPCRFAVIPVRFGLAGAGPGAGHDLHGQRLAPPQIAERHLRDRQLDIGLDFGQIGTA